MLLGWRQQQPGYDAGKEAPHDQGKEYDDVLERENESRIRSVGDEGSLREGSLYAAIGALTRWTQTAALAEVGHAVLGMFHFHHFKNTRPSTRIIATSLLLSYYIFNSTLFTQSYVQIPMLTFVHTIHKY